MRPFIKIEYLHSVNRIVLTLLLCVASMAFAQTPENSNDIKVGVVLSGGGAKGLAHIGALKVIEKAGIPIDYIGGTSMGAIVGALYASGYTANQLDSIFRVVDFDRLIQDELPRSAKTLYEKEDSERYAITLPFDNFKITVPKSISKGQNIYNLFVKLLNHVNDVRDFNDLPIPFFCMATDVESGEAVLLDKGYLPEAIAASGAFPSLFQPVEIDGRLLIDGGVVNNYPIDELKSMGATFVIGVDVQDALENREALQSATGILLQINNYRTVRDMVKKAEKTDIYIKPDIRDFSVISFDEGKQIIKNGEKAALEKEGEFLELKKKITNPYTPQKPVKIQDSVILNNIFMMGNDKYTRSYVRGKLRYKTGERLSFDKLQQGINNLMATNNYQSIRYQLRPSEGLQDLSLKLKETTNTMLLRLGLHYDDLYKSGALVNLTKKRLLLDDDVASLDIVLGDNVRYNFEYYVDKGFYWSIGINSRFNSFHKSIPFSVVQQEADIPLIEVEEIEVDYSDFTNQLYIQTVLREEFAFGVGIEHKRIKIESETISGSDGEAVFDNSDYGSTFGFLKLDTYDNKYYPKKGVYFDGDFHLYLFSSDFTNTFDEFSIGKAKIGVAIPFFQKFALNIYSEGGFTIGNTELNTFDFALGGYGNDLINNLIPFMGYDFLSLPGNSFVKGTIRGDFEFYKKNHLMFTANYANIADDIFERAEWFKEPDFSGYGIGYGLETLIGPMEITYSWTPETGKGRWYFNVGFWF